jgi:hypothetical protein
MQRSPLSIDDLQTRAFYRQWQADLLGLQADHTDGPPAIDRRDPVRV